MKVVNGEVFYAGIDGGGTHCRVRIESSCGQFLGQGIGGTANPSHGRATVILSIMTAFKEALKQAELSEQHYGQFVVGAGLAGLHLPRYLTMMQNWQHPFKAMYYTDDLHVATIGAHAGGDGAMVIVGTGFSALSLVNGVKTMIGGYGFLQADHCSGSWLGYQAVQKALLSYDGYAQPSLLCELVTQHFNASGYQLADTLAEAGARDFGAIAPLVFNAAAKGDVVAQQLIKDSCQFIVRTIDLLKNTNPPRITLLGGVARQLIPMLPVTLAKELSSPIHNAEQGAISFAKHMQLRAN
ncbi:BadF/BadG/BcrA/BcrD ATPase family protein [Thalassotalea sp. PP2-459]|uniref:BadF/BadG/BcrA/BcrD ATPase family protein n=1 Tax=Thalassotalea sp. PP2-459 TaxID=1742724 RepID=UPI000945C20E|nr:BadF/BadG/BcrA/BcrD ATPase family protein [Thalassotalea sp. PP2-459]OKY26546.1 hypothetical protein BI291_11385 [Thalassotalea sp. PP2-459]